MVVKVDNTRHVAGYSCFFDCACTEPEYPCGNLLLIHRHAVTSRRLGCVKGTVNPLEPKIMRFTRPKFRYAHADRDPSNLGEGFPGNPLTQAFRHLDRLLTASVRQQHHKFLPAPACQHVGRAQMLPNPVAQRDDY